MFSLRDISGKCALLYLKYVAGSSLQFFTHIRKLYHIFVWKGPVIPFQSQNKDKPFSLAVIISAV